MTLAAFLFLAPALLGLAALLSRTSEPHARSRFLQVLAGVGLAIAIVTFFAPVSGEVWRTTVMDPNRAHLIGIATACAWLLFLTVERTRLEGDWDACLLVGVGSSGLALFGANEWVIPALLFWVVTALASAALTFRVPGTGAARASIFGATALVAASVAGELLDGAPWELHELSGWQWGLLVAAIVVLSGAVPGTGGWSSFGRTTSAPAFPLSTGAAFLLVASPSSTDEPYVALALILVGIGAGIASVVRPVLEVRLIGTWAVSLMLGLAFVAPAGQVPARAGFAAVIVVTGLILWPMSLGRAQIERGLLVAFVSITTGFNAISLAAGGAFGAATSTEDVVAAAPWAMIAALLPAALASGVILGARIGRRAEPEDYTVEGVLATWALFLAAIAWGLFPVGSGSGVGGFWLYVVAAVVGAGAARVTARRGSASEIPSGEADELDLRILEVSSVIEGGLSRGALVLGAASVLAVLVLTYQGLRLGFL